MHTILNSLSPLKELSLTKGDTLFRIGDAVKYFYIIKSGRIRMSRLTLNGKETVMYEARGNDSFAEASLFSEHYHCNAIALEQSTITVFDKANLLYSLSHNPELNQSMLKMLANQVQLLRSQLELHNIKSAHERVYHFLSLNADDNGIIHLSSSLKDIAMQLGLAHETFYRALSTLEKNALINRTKEGEISLCL